LPITPRGGQNTGDRSQESEIRMNPLLNPPLVKGEDKKIKIILPFSKGELEGFVEFSLLML